MLDIFVERIRQKHRTYPYPKKDPAMPPLFKGLPILHEYTGDTCLQWEDTMAQCPADALFLDDEGVGLDMGKCTFCGACAQREPGNFLREHESVFEPSRTHEGGKHSITVDNGGLVCFSGCWQLASTDRRALIIRPGQGISPPPVVVDTALQALFTKSFRFRQVSAGGCNACEADLNVLTTLAFDISRFGMDFVASPRHADAMAITGPVTRNMQGALLKVDNAMPKPRISIAVGACAISGGLFNSQDNKQQADGVEPHLDVDLYIPGCPPHPYTILDGFLRFLGRIQPAACQ